MCIKLGELPMSTLLSKDLSKGKRNDAVGITRVISMFMIIGCHVFSWLEINSLAMILNVGIYIFFDYIRNLIFY